MMLVAMLGPIMMMTNIPMAMVLMMMTVVVVGDYTDGNYDDDHDDVFYDNDDKNDDPTRLGKLLIGLGIWLGGLT